MSETEKVQRPQPTARKSKKNLRKPKSAELGHVLEGMARMAHTKPSRTGVVTRSLSMSQAALLARIRGQKARVRLVEPEPPATLDQLAREVLGTNSTLWFQTPNPNFGGRKPEDLVGSDEEQKVVNLLKAVDLGLF